MSLYQDRQIKGFLLFLTLFALLFLLTFGVPMFAAFHTQGSSDLVSLLHSAVLTAPIL